MSPASVLNPLANSFHPRFGEPLDFGTIYIEGVPSASFSGTAHPEHNTLHNIPDDAIDEAFPPSADEAAELDAVMDFVLTMSYLNVVEEQEERARTNFSHVAGKRWEARRSRGMVGRPHPAKSPKAGSFVGMAKNHQMYSQETDIVPYDWGKKVHMPFHDLECMRSRNVGRGHHGMHGKTGGRYARGRSYTKPIQQPRKQNR